MHTTVLMFYLIISSLQIRALLYCEVGTLVRPKVRLLAVDTIRPALSVFHLPVMLLFFVAPTLL